MWSLDVLRDLFRHMAWADEEIWNAAGALSDRPVDERLRKLLLHLHVVPRAFLHIWTRREIVFPDPGDFPSLVELRAWAKPYGGELGQFLETVPADRLTEPVDLPWVREFERELGRSFHHPTLGETMFQVTSHSTYHRGQVNVRLRELGAEPPLVDYIAWVWFGRPSHNKSAASRV